MVCVPGRRVFLDIFVNVCCVRVLNTAPSKGRSISRFLVNTSTYYYYKNVLFCGERCAGLYLVYIVGVYRTRTYTDLAVRIVVPGISCGCYDTRMDRLHH